MDITFATFMTAVGCGTAAVLITALISLIKTTLPDRFSVHLDGAVLAFVLSAILYVLVGIDAGVSTLNAGLAVFVAWLTCATAAVGAHKVIIKPAIDSLAK